MKTGILSSMQTDLVHCTARHIQRHAAVTEKSKCNLKVDDLEHQLVDAKALVTELQSHIKDTKLGTHKLKNPLHNYTQPHPCEKQCT